MPYYDYRCTECGHLEKDVRKGINDPHPTKCNACEEQSLELSYDNYDSIVQYKGKGWFKTDGKY